MIIMLFIDFQQKIVSILASLLGNKSFIINWQVRINTARYENDVPDKSKVIMTDENGNWVQ